MDRKKILEVKNFPNLVKNISLWFKETQIPPQKKKRRNSNPNNLLKNFNCQATHFMPIIITKKKEKGVMI